MLTLKVNVVRQFLMVGGVISLKPVLIRGSGRVQRGVG